jgi:hypothetical protein
MDPQASAVIKLAFELFEAKNNSDNPPKWAGNETLAFYPGSNLIGPCS